MECWIIYELSNIQMILNYPLDRKQVNGVISCFLFRHSSNEKDCLEKNQIVLKKLEIG
jgi:hypothetical protein